MPTKSARLQHIHYPPESDNQEQNKFPNSRYFQIHFEYLESQLTETRCYVEMLHAQMAELSFQVSRLHDVLINPKNNK